MDLRRTDAPSQGRLSTQGRESRELASMIVLHRKTLAGVEVASLPDLSMQFIHVATHYTQEKNAAEAHYAEQIG